MAVRLRERGYACVQTPLPATGFTYDLVTCLNVLDRTGNRSLLRRLRGAYPLRRAAGVREM